VANLNNILISLQKIADGDMFIQNRRTVERRGVSESRRGPRKEQQDKGLGARVKLKTPHERVGESLGDGGSARAAAGYAQDLASGEYGSKSKAAQIAIDRGGMRGAARHGARRALKETWGDKYRKDHEQGGSKVGQRATEMGRESTYPYKKEPESRSERV